MYPDEIMTAEQQASDVRFAEAVAWLMMEHAESGLLAFMGQRLGEYPTGLVYAKEIDDAINAAIAALGG